MVYNLLEELHDMSIFSEFDLKLRYYQIQIHKNDMPNMAFKIHQRHSQFVIIPFRLSNASMTFQSIVDYIFGPYLYHFVLIFFNDLLVYNYTLKDNEHHLDAMF